MTTQFDLIMHTLSALDDPPAEPLPYSRAWQLMRALRRVERDAATLRAARLDYPGNVTELAAVARLMESER